MPTLTLGNPDEEETSLGEVTREDDDQVEVDEENEAEVDFKLLDTSVEDGVVKDSNSYTVNNNNSSGTPGMYSFIVFSLAVYFLSISTHLSLRLYRAL
ncbi:hypothetical protein PoB_000607600 [Plakobranchus ocellatus]|uniref:Uncharacterized protein n=1 Tax=Plakobranchus ocellatus TaxID=259542 RepID=A0AAV3YB19_9GAST|nr:hypothetical protein PoB_000607600 [Plakobranchus ocellatus]